MTEVGGYQTALLVLGAIIAALLFIVFNNSGKLSNGVPQPVVMLLLDMLLPLLKQWAQAVVDKTPTTLDNEVLKQIITLVEQLRSLYGPPPPPAQTAPPQPQPPWGPIQPPFIVGDPPSTYPTVTINTTTTSTSIDPSVQ